VPTEPRAWLLGIARKALANSRRSAARRSRLEERLAAQPARASDSEASHGSDRVLTALAALSERDREVLLLIAWDGLGHDEAAVACGCSRQALRVRLHRARRRFAAELDRAHTPRPPAVGHPWAEREDTVP
jgi:RNA polymerase sigma factor (sigma-70 family)